MLLGSSGGLRTVNAPTLMTTAPRSALQEVKTRNDHENMTQLKIVIYFCFTFAALSRTCSGTISSRQQELRANYNGGHEQLTRSTVTNDTEIFA
jgi:hypothetical protein